MPSTARSALGTRAGVGIIMTPEAPPMRDGDVAGAKRVAHDHVLQRKA